MQWVRSLWLRPSREQKQMIEIVFVRFISTGDWPRLEEVRRRLLAAGLSEVLVESMPPWLGCLDDQGKGDPEDRRIILTVRALRLVTSATDIIDDFMRAVRLAGNGYRNYESSPELSVAELATELSLSSRRAQQVMLLLESEGLVSGSGCGEGTGKVTREIAKCASARSSGQYVRQRKVPRRTSTPAPTGLRKWLQEREHTTRDLIVIAFIGALLFYGATEAIPEALDGGGSSEGHSTPSQRDPRGKGGRDSKRPPQRKSQSAPPGVDKSRD
jgi:hypothetical protein